MLLATIVPLVARLLPEVLVPSLFRFKYTVDELVLFLALVTGAVIGVRKGLPLWSYTWIVLTVVSIVAFLTSFLPTLLFDAIDFRPGTLGWLFTGTHLFGGLLALAFAASRAYLGLRCAFFASGIYLAGSTASPYIMEPTVGWSTFELVVTNTLSIIIAVIMLAVTVAAVVRFLHGNPDTQRRSAYVLIGIALLDPVLTGWVFLPVVPRSEIISAIGFWGLQILVRSAYIGAALLVTYALVILFLWLRKVSTNNLASSGEIDG